MEKSAYTYKTLMLVRKQYRANFDKLMTAVDTPDHAKYIKEERRLYKLEVAVQSALGIFLQGPICPSDNTHCIDCSKKGCTFRYVYHTKRKKAKVQV